MQYREIALCKLTLTVSCLIAVGAVFAKNAPQSLQSDEYAAVALIYNQELSALGNRALFPICLEMPSGTPMKPLLQYLRKGGDEISDESVCEPAMAPNGQHHPRDYPHGLRISIDKFQRDPGGVISMHVESGDLTLRPGEHVAEMLRRGTYHLKRNDERKWQVVGYTKEYDSQDNKGSG